MQGGLKCWSCQSPVRLCLLGLPIWAAGHLHERPVRAVTRQVLARCVHAALSTSPPTQQAVDELLLRDRCANQQAALLFKRHLSQRHLEF